MPPKLRTDKVADAITPIATRVAKDPELREHARAVLDSAKVVLDKVQHDGARSAAGNKAVQDEVVRAAKEIKQGASRLATKQSPSKKRRAAKAAAAGAVAVGAVVVAKKAMSKDEDEFEYTP
ncbi:MAG: hypothetical protein QOG02_1007 [Gaiellales bacterium]|nr:hypothetical protein [Gaiellales bacterium]MDX6545233.1 hypothetical protein [Gaiellales bacterium]